jgi:hypothetical protein
LAGVDRSSGIFNSIGKLYSHVHERDLVQQTVGQRSMPHSVFFMKDGHAIHGSNDVKNLGKPASHGCVRISPENATTLYALVGKSGLENTHVVLSGVTPGGEYRGAGPASAARYYQPAPGAYEYGYATQGYAAQLRMQPAIAGRSGGYYAPQGYYVVPRPYTQQW